LRRDSLKDVLDSIIKEQKEKKNPVYSILLRVGRLFAAVGAPRSGSRFGWLGKTLKRARRGK
jgi:hypothetical protein